MLTQVDIEKTGARFDSGLILEARKKTWAAVELIASRFAPGLSEKEATDLANQTMKELGTTKQWHKTHVRFGENTLKHYGLPSEGNPVLGENDIFFLDVGPVWDGFEADVGKTYAVGSDAEMIRCAADAIEIHSEVRNHWAEHQVGGKALYDYARERAESRGWIINLFEANGHRLSDFPHKLYFTGGISDVEFTPTACRWVLEIQIRHPQRPFGAFYEDLLV